MTGADFINEYRNTLREWVNFETPSGAGERLNAFLRLLREAFSQSGAEIKIHEDQTAPVLHACLGNGENRCVLIGHADTVFPLGKAEKFDEENGRFYGAGILDMKSGLFMMKKLFDAFREKLPDNWRLEAIINTDEENGSVKSAEVIGKILNGAKCAFVFEGSPERKVTVQRKGILRFGISIKGTASHASAGDPEKKSAVYALSGVLNDLYEMPLADASTMNIGIVKAGSAVNIVADKAEVEGEIRALNEKELKDAFERIVKIASAHRGEAFVLSVRPPMNESKKLFALVKEASEKTGYPVEGRIAGGGSDGAFASRLNIDVIDGMGAEGARAHTRREYAEGNSLKKRFDIAYETLLLAMKA